MKTLEKMTVGDYVADDFRSAALFSKYGIDFCCKGNRTLEEVCDKKELDVATLEKEIQTVLETKNENGIDFKSWPSDLLTDYIEKTHHRYIEEKTPTILQFLDKLCKVHGERHPELFEINILFKISATALAQHLKKEELILFPFVKKMEQALKAHQAIEQPHFGTINNPIEMLKDDHVSEGDLFAKIEALTKAVSNC